MKFSDGIFHQVFNEVAKEYPDLENEHYIVDIGTAKLATKPEKFDVIVTSNLFGDIISDITAEISGSVGLAGSANIGQNYAMFEAIHGSAPDIADQNIANPSGLLNGAIMMLVHIGQADIAMKIENAWKKTIEDGIHSADIYNEKTSVKKVNTKEFTEAIIARLGQEPRQLKPAKYNNSDQMQAKIISYSNFIDELEEKKLVGVDIYIDLKANSAELIADKISSVKIHGLKIETISTKGLKVWPRDDEYMVESDHWCCRFMSDNESKNIIHLQISNILQEFANAEIDFIKVENLYEYNGKRGYSLAQGE